MLDDKSRVILFWFTIGMVVVVVIVALTTLLQAWGGPLEDESPLAINPAEISLCLGEQHRFTVEGIGEDESADEVEVSWRTSGGTLDESGPLAANFTADGEPGDLYIQGPSAAMMYWGNRAKTRETFQGGWTKSGDKYVRNADGTYTYSGRSDDMLKVSGIYVSPFEVEATLVQHPAVLEAAVIGVPDAEGLTKTKAFVVLKQGGKATEDELKAFVKDKLAPYKYPRMIEFVADLPKTATGKIQRFKLREREAGK